jgi:hypothetical protein
MKANKRNTHDLSRLVAKKFTGLPPQAVFTEMRTMAPIITDRDFRRNVSIVMETLDNRRHPSNHSQGEKRETREIESFPF